MRPLTGRQTRLACILAIVCCFGIVFAASHLFPDDDSSDSKDVDGPGHFNDFYDDFHTDMNRTAASIKGNQSDSGAWESRNATALSTLALLECGTTASSVYLNHNGSNVSLGAGNSSAMNVITDHSTFENDFDPNSPVSVNSLNVHLQVTHVFSPGSEAEENYTRMLLYSQDGNGSWANSAVATAGALETLSLAGELEDDIYETAAAFQMENGNPATVIIAMSAALRAEDGNPDSAIMDELVDNLSRLLEMQQPDGSFDLTGPHPTSDSGPSVLADTFLAVHALSVSYRYYTPYDNITTPASNLTTSHLEALVYLVNSSPFSHDPQEPLPNDHEMALRLYEMSLAAHAIDAWYRNESFGPSGQESAWIAEDFPLPGQEMHMDIDYEKSSGTATVTVNYSDGVATTDSISDGEPILDRKSDGASDDGGPGGVDFLPDVMIDSEIFVPFSLSLVLSIVSVSFILLYARIGRKNAFDGIRKDIYEFIQENPGEHFSAIMRHFNISPSSATHHLQVLEYLGFVSAYKYEKYKRFYLKNHPAEQGMPASCGIPPKEKHVISLMKNRTTRHFVGYVLTNPHANQKEIATILQIHPSTVSWHARRLVRGEILSQIREGKDVFYRVRHPDMVGDLLKKIVEEA